jgi:GAF domain-containing protein
VPMPRKMGQLDSLAPRADADRADDFRELLEPGAIRAVFQPIVRLTDLEPIGYEGLARFPTPPGLVALPPDVTLAAAARSGLRHDLEVACWAAMTAHEPLRGAVASSLIVLPLTAAGQRVGVLALADRTPRRLPTEHVELLELLAVQAAGGLRMAAAVLELHERAARDPLTGLGHHATFHDTLPAVRQATRRGRSTAVLLADVDGLQGDQRHARPRRR